MKKIILLVITIFSFMMSKAQCDVNVREAFGGISTITIYNTYLTIGAIADAHVNEVYDANRVTELMKEQTNMIESVINMLNKCKEVKNNGLTKDDVDYVKDLINCLTSLKNEAQGLNDFVSNGSQDAQNRYISNRDKAWKQITALMGIEE